MRRLLMLLMLFGAFSIPAFAQDGYFRDIAFNWDGTRLVPSVSASVTVCASTASGVPCTPTSTIWQDSAHTIPQTNPITTATDGSWSFHATPGQYVYTVTGSGLVPQGPILITVVSSGGGGGGGGLNPGTVGNVVQYGTTTQGSDSGVPVVDLAQTNISNKFTASQTVQGNVTIQGPTPHVDAAAYGARAIVVTGYTTTATCTSGLNTVTLAGTAQLQNGDGISLYGCGPTNTMSTPSGVTVTPSEAAHETGLGVDVSAPSGSTGFSYKVVALGTWSATPSSDFWGAYTAASTAGTTSTGNTLGPQTASISTLSETNGIETITCTCALSTGAVVNIVGTSNDYFFCGWYTVATGGTNSFTIYTGYHTSSATTGTGGTLLWFNNNHITWGAVTGAFEYAIYGRTSGTWNLIGFSWPGQTWFDDYGSTMSANGAGYGWLPTSAPSSAQNGVLTTTVTAGGGTTSLTLAANAANNTTSTFATLDEVPNLTAATTAAVTSGGPLFIPCNSSRAGTRFIIGSYWQVGGNIYSANVQQCGSLWVEDPIEWDAGLNWFGDASGNNNSAVSVGLANQAEIDVTTAYPGIYSSNVISIFADHTMLNQLGSGTNMALLTYLTGGGPGIVWQNSAWETGGGNSNNDYMGIQLIVNTVGDNTFTNDSWVSGPAQAANLTSTPLVVMTGNGGQNHFDNISMNRRGMASVNQLAVKVEKGSWNQGPITPFLMSNASSSAIGPTTLEGILQDTSFQPIFANVSTAVYRGTVEIDSPDVSGYPPVTGTGVANLILKDIAFPSYNSAFTGQNQNYQTNTSATVQNTSETQGYPRGILEQEQPNYQAQPSPGNFFIEQLPGAPTSTASAGGSLTGSHYYGVVAHFPNGTSRTGPAGNTPSLGGGNGTIVSTWSAVSGATSYDVWDLTRGLPTACAGLTLLSCTDTGGVLTASSGFPNAPSDGYPSLNPSGVNSPAVTTAAVTSNVVKLPEGSAPSGISATDLLYGKSSTHWVYFNNNNAGEVTVAGITGAITGGHCAQFVDAYHIQDNGSACGSGGTGTVTSFSAGNLSPLFTSSVATATTTPALTFSLSNFNAHTWYGNNTGSSGAPAANLIGASDIGPPSYAPDSGAVNAAVVTLPVAATALTPGLHFWFLPTANNTSSTPTVNVNGLGAKTIEKLSGGGLVALANGDLCSTGGAHVWYDGTEFQLENPCTTAASGANTALSNLAAVAVNAALLPGTTNSIALGSATKGWTDLFLANAGSYSHFSTSATAPRLVTLPDAPSATAQALTAGTGQFASAFSATTGLFSTKTLTSTTGASGMTFTDNGTTVTVAPASTTGGGNAILQCTQTGGANGQYFGITGGICQNITPGVVDNHGVTCSGLTITQAYNGQMIFCTDAGSAAVTLNSPASYSTNFYFKIVADGAGTVTVTASGNVRGSGSLAIPGGAHDSAAFFNNGSTWDANTATGF